MAKRLAITGVSSMQAWDEGAKTYARPTRLRSVASFAASASDLAAFTTLPQGCTTPVEILVGDIAKRSKTRLWRACLKKDPLPSGSLWDLGDNRCLTAPEYFFLRTAPRLSFAQAVLLGMEICGHYSTLMSAPYRKYCDMVRREQGGSLLANPWPPTEWEMSVEHQRQLMQLGFISRPSLASGDGLRDYLSRALSEGSHSRAILAARHIKDGSRSPMESRLYARYCLPRRYGGLSLLPVELNRTFTLSADVAKTIGVTHFSVDLYWPTASIAIEYQGKEVHSGLTAEQRDRLKRNILEVEGVRILSIDAAQYDNKSVLELYGSEIAAGMGKASWELKPRRGEQQKRYALADELRDWESDLYRV